MTDTAKGKIKIGRLREVLSYSPETGEFTWLVTNGPHAREGNRAGTDHPEGYRVIRVDGVRYLSHRLAWFYVNGEWPKEQLDHRNGIRNDNRISNLREANQSQNSQNQAVRRDSKSGHTGVHWLERERKWSAVIQASGKTIRLGQFNSLDLAVSARAEAKAKFHEFQPKERTETP